MLKGHVIAPLSNPVLVAAMAAVGNNETSLTSRELNPKRPVPEAKALPRKKCSSFTVLFRKIKSDQLQIWVES